MDDRNEKVDKYDRVTDLSPSHASGKPSWMLNMPPRNMRYFDQPRLSAETVLQQLRDDGILGKSRRLDTEGCQQSLAFYIPVKAKRQLYSSPTNKRKPRLLEKIAKATCNTKTEDNLKEKMAIAEKNQSRILKDIIGKQRLKSARIHQVKEKREKEIAMRRMKIENKHRRSEEKLSQTQKGRVQLARQSQYYRKSEPHASPPPLPTNPLSPPSFDGDQHVDIGSRKYDDLDDDFYDNESDDLVNSCDME